MTAYYNEVDPYAAQWLRNLIAAGEIAPGDVDERDIRDVTAGDLRGYTQAHFFAGIGGWSVALRLASWPDDRPVWSGSCPCQPFSAAGAGKAADDERHLWPDWFRLIRACRPPVVLGEQVEAAIGWGWLDAVFADLEAEGYACGAAVLPAASVGAPHIRNRLWFVADAGCGRIQRRAELGGLAGADRDAEGEAQQRQRSGDAARDGGADGLVADHTGSGRAARPQRDARANGWQAEEPRRLRDAGLLADADAAGQRLIGRDGLLDRERAAQGLPRRARQPRSTHWSDLIWLPCSDGKARPTGPGVFPLAHGVQRRPSKLRAYGNAIVPQVAAAFIETVS